MQLVRQPKGSNLCGQACVATLCGIDLETAIRRLGGTRGKTRTKQLLGTLHAYGWSTGPGKLVRGFPKCKTALLFFRHVNGNRHWVIWHKTKYYDPLAGVHRNVPKYLAESTVTSHLPLEKRREN